MKTDVVIVGAGPAGIFTALEMLRRETRHMAVILALLLYGRFASEKSGS